MFRRVSGRDTKMRVKALILGAAIACLAQPLVSQTTLGQTLAGEKPVAGKPVPPQGRVGSLSPDEARRAERSRKRAAEAAKPRKDAKPREAAKEQPARKEAVERPAPPRPSLVVRKTPQRAREIQGPARHETVRAEEARPVTRSARAPESRRRRYVERSEAMPPRMARRMWRRRYAGQPYWRPRVGAFVPTGVPLYQLPSGYGYSYAPYYRVGGQQPGYVYGAPPPFPGQGFGNDDDNN